MSEENQLDTIELDEIGKIIAEVQEQNEKVKANLKELREKSESIEKKINIEMDKNNEMISKAQELGEDQKRIDKLITDQLNMISEKFKALEIIEQELQEKEEAIGNLIKDAKK